MFLFTLLFLILIVLLFYSFFLAMNLSIIKKQPKSLTRSAVSGELSSQSKLPFYHHESHPPVSWELPQQLRKWQPEFLGRGLEIICSWDVLQGSPQWLPRAATVPGGHEGRSLTGPVTLGTFSSPCFCCGSTLGSPVTLFHCAGCWCPPFLSGEKDFTFLKSKEGACKVKAPPENNQKYRLTPI